MKAIMLVEDKDSFSTIIVNSDFKNIKKKQHRGETVVQKDFTPWEVNQRHVIPFVWWTFCGLSGDGFKHETSSFVNTSNCRLEASPSPRLKTYLPENQKYIRFLSTP